MKKYDIPKEDKNSIKTRPTSYKGSNDSEFQFIYKHDVAEMKIEKIKTFPEMELAVENLLERIYCFLDEKNS